MICGIGVDIVEISRFATVTDSFMNRVFTPHERDYLAGKNAQRAQSTAGLFAAKEAVAKALGTGFTGFAPTDIEITHDQHGKPGVILHPKTRAAAEAHCESYTIHISISHSDSNAIAYAVMEKINKTSS